MLGLIKNIQFLSQEFTTIEIKLHRWCNGLEYGRSWMRASIRSNQKQSLCSQLLH